MVGFFVARYLQISFMHIFVQCRMPLIPTWIPLIERIMYGGVFILYVMKMQACRHVSKDSVIDSLARKRSKEAYGIFNIKDAYLLELYLSGGISIS